MLTPNGVLQLKIDPPEKKKQNIRIRIISCIVEWFSINIPFAIRDKRHSLLYIGCKKQIPRLTRVRPTNSWLLSIEFPRLMIMKNEFVTSYLPKFPNQLCANSWATTEATRCLLDVELIDLS